MKKFEIINYLIKQNSYKKYLEIGTRQKSGNFNKISCDYKLSVDPDPKSDADFKGTSDDFFQQNKEKFDLVFIDGLHLYEQVFKDILNTLMSLEIGGTIVCHDMLPSNEKEQLREIQITWTGDCWKAWVKCRSLFENLEMYIIDTEHGLGIIKRGKQDLIKNPEILDWNWFKQNKNLMNIISIEDFLNKK